MTFWPIWGSFAGPPSGSLVGAVHVLWTAAGERVPVSAKLVKIKNFTILLAFFIFGPIVSELSDFH